MFGTSINLILLFYWGKHYVNACRFNFIESSQCSKVGLWAPERLTNALTSHTARGQRLVSGLNNECCLLEIIYEIWCPNAYRPASLIHSVYFSELKTWRTSLEGLSRPGQYFPALLLFSLSDMVEDEEAACGGQGQFPLCCWSTWAALSSPGTTIERPRSSRTGMISLGKRVIAHYNICEYL